MTDYIDRSGQVRAGEELPVAELQAYLHTQLPDLAGDLAVTQFPRGYSNLTYLLSMDGREMVLRRPPFGMDIASAHDMGREYRVLSGLIRVYPKVPRPLFYCRDEAVIGAPFYVMERLSGVVLRAQLPSGMILMPQTMRALSEAVIDNLAAIHALDVHAAGLADLGRPQGYIERQVRGWVGRYRHAQTSELPELEVVMAWLEQHMPLESGASIIHNDYKYDNLVLDPNDLTQVLAVLDWEMCTLGDPLMDLGTTLGYWIEAGDPPALVNMFGLPALPGNLDRRQLVDRYAQTSGRSVSDPLFYYVYGLFKVAVIIQQLYGRYRQGYTEDARFAALNDVVGACAQMAEMALARGRIHQLSG